MKLTDYLALDINDRHNIQIIASFLFDSLDDLKKCNFCCDNIHIIPSLVSKFMDVRNFYIGDTKDNTNINRLSENLIYEVEENCESSEEERRKNSSSEFSKIYSSLVSCYSTILKKENSSTYINDFDTLYNPEFSDKKTAIELLNEAINIITNAQGIPASQVKQILYHLKKALKNLESNSPNWTIHFGNIHQLILILGSLGSIASGTIGYMALQEANDKLIKVSEVISTTSINNVINLDMTFNNFNYNVTENNISHSQAILPGPNDCDGQCETD